MKTCSCTWTYVHAHEHMCMHMNIHVHVHENLWLYMKTCACTWKHVHVHEHMCMHMNICACTWTYVHVHENMWLYMKTCACTWKHVHIHIHMCQHSATHSPTYDHFLSAATNKNSLKNIFCGQCLSLSFQHTNNAYKVILYTTALLCFPKNLTYTLAGFEPVPSRSWGGCDVHCTTPLGPKK
jgi:hypothetical protein